MVTLAGDKSFHLAYKQRKLVGFMDVLVTAIIIAVMLVIIGVFAFIKYSQRSGGNDDTWNPRREGTNDDSDRLGTNY